MEGITKQQFNTLEDLFSYYNRFLFDNELPFCLINLSRHRGAAGYFIAENWKSDTGEPKHEISINPDTLNLGDEYWHGTLVHEMCHMWQTEFGHASRRSYHNKEWAQKMFEVGLMPSDTGQPGGKNTGQHMDHYVIKNGPFHRAFLAINLNELNNLHLPYITNANSSSQEGGTEKTNKSTKSGVKKKYTCGCGTNVWGKSNLYLKCLICNSNFKEME